MTSRTSRSYDHDLERAIKFLVFQMHESGHNPKPVILHSIRMAMHLNDLGYEKDIVIAALLHDLIEDSETRIEEIKKEFGDEVAGLVEAMTFNPKLPQGKRFFGNFDRLLKKGREALIIAAADFLDDSNYYHLADTEELRKWLVEKRKIFIEKTEPILKNEPIWQELKSQKVKVI